MPLELAALLAAIAGARTAVREGAEIIESIRGVTHRSRQVKEDLTAKLQDLEELLQAVGKTGEVAESYFRTTENVRTLLSLCQRLLQFVDDNSDALGDWRRPLHAGSWRMVDATYRQVAENSDAPQKVLLDRGEWYDERDKAQITAKLKEFSSAYDRAKGFVDAKQKEGLKNELEQMIRPLIQADRLLTSTLYEQILINLQRLRS